MSEFEFDSGVRKLKYRVLKEVAKAAYNGTLTEDIFKIPEKVVPGPKPTMRCCVYKERAIVLDRIKLALGGNKEIDNVIETIKTACDECPLGGYEVTNRCRGCIAKSCKKACKKGAITIDPVTQRSYIDKSKCVECGMCAKACPYQAIQNYTRPCQKACKVGAIGIGPDNEAVIDNEKCIQCGQCVISCPFGAIMDKSSIVDVIKLIKESENNTKYQVIAMIAPSFATQMKEEENAGQFITAVRKLGFGKVVEAALGADMVAYKEAKELVEKGVLTSSCCPTFVKYIEQQFPMLKDKISSNLSPMAELGKYIKEKEPTSKVVFIGPCLSKKQEIKKDNVKDYIDFALTFEEINAMERALEIDPSKLEETNLDDASYFGRVFGYSGGLVEAVKQGVKELAPEFELKAANVEGFDDIRVALSKLKVGVNDFNFLEGMACPSGCMGGPGCIFRRTASKKKIADFGHTASVETISDSVNKHK